MHMVPAIGTAAGPATSADGADVATADTTGGALGDADAAVGTILGDTITGDQGAIAETQTNIASHGDAPTMDGAATITADVPVPDSAGGTVSVVRR